jgi:hypothetical protein
MSDKQREVKEKEKESGRQENSSRQDAERKAEEKNRPDDHDTHRKAPEGPGNRDRN